MKDFLFLVPISNETKMQYRPKVKMSSKIEGTVTTPLGVENSKLIIKCNKFNANFTPLDKMRKL